MKQDSRSRKSMPRSGASRGRPDVDQEHGPYAMPDMSSQQQQRQEKGSQQPRQPGATPNTSVNTAHTGHHFDEEREDDEGYLRDDREELMEEETEEAH